MAKKRKKKKSNGLGKTFIMVFLIMIIAFTAIIFAIDKFGLGIPNPIAGGDGPLSDLYRDSDRVNVLLLGDTVEGLTDTIMVGSYDLKNQHVDIISVPRDTYYPREDYPGAALAKINSVKKTEGIEGTIDAVSDVLVNMPIHCYAMVGDDDIVKIVDAMGGVPMDVPMDMKYTDKGAGLYIDLKKGEQVLDGEQAVQFLRFRSGYKTGDYGRVEAQQQFMSNALDQAMGWKLPKTALTVIENVDTNMTAGNAVRLGIKGIFLEKDGLEKHILPGEAEYRNGASYFIHDADETEDLVRTIYSYEKE